MAIMSLASTIAGQNIPLLDSLPKFDSLTVEDDVDIDSNYFYVFDRWGDPQPLGRMYSDSALSYWEYRQPFMEDRFHWSLGNTGSAAYAAYGNYGGMVGFDVGLHQYDLYRTQSDQIKYIASGRAYTDLRYNQSPQQTKSNTNILFGRSVSANSGVSVQYDRINDEGEYQNQKFRQTSIGVGLFHHFAKNRIVQLGIASNNITSEENWGISQDIDLSDPIYKDREGVPVQSTTALNTLKDREARLSINWNLRAREDTIQRGLSLLLESGIGVHRNHFADNNIYDIYGPYLIDDRGTQVLVRHRQWWQVGGVRLAYGSKSQSSLDGRLDVTLKYVSNRYEISQQTSEITDLILQGSWRQQLSHQLLLKGQIDYNVGDLTHDYRLDAQIQLKPLSSIILSGGIYSQRKTPTGITRQLVILDHTLFDIGGSAAFYNRLYGRLTLPQWGLNAELSSTILENHIVYSDQLLPERIGVAFNLFQFKLRFQKMLGILYMDHHVYMQQSAHDKLPVPSLMTKHYVGLKWRLFNQRLHIDSGCQVKYLASTVGYGYIPVTGSFYPTNQELPFDYLVDGVLGFRIDQFHFYFKLEQMNTIWNKNVQYLIHEYPQFDARLRIGFRWLLRG